MATAVLKLVLASCREAGLRVDSMVPAELEVAP